MNNTSKSNNNKQQQKKKFKLTLPLIATGTDENIGAAFDVVSKIPFNNFRIPIYAKKCDVIKDNEETKTIIVGYIKGFHEDVNNISAIIFNQYVEPLKNRDDFEASIVYNTYNDKFTTIVRIEIVKLD